MNEGSFARDGANPAKDGARWLSMSESALFGPYSAEYLSLLARKGKLPSKKIGNTWYTTRNALEGYMKKQMLRTQVQNGNYHGITPLVSGLPELTKKKKIEEPDPLSLKQVRSYKSDTSDFFTRSGVSLESILSKGEKLEETSHEKLVEKISAHNLQHAETGQKS